MLFHLASFKYILYWFESVGFIIALLIINSLESCSCIVYTCKHSTIRIE
jgi:uncharacterized membrane protein